MRPIDADALIEKCGGWYVEEGTESGFIGTLENLLATEPTIQPQSTTGQLNDGAWSTAQSTDLIDRQAAIDALEGGAEFLRRVLDVTDLVGVEREKYAWGLDLLEACIADVKELPSAQPERKKGRWLPDNNSMYEMRFICSECKESEVVPTIGFAKYKPIWDYCPNCGAKMKGAKHETD